MAYSLVSENNTNPIWILTRSGAVAARQAHNLKVGGSNPSSANGELMKKNSNTKTEKPTFCYNCGTEVKFLKYGKYYCPNVKCDRLYFDRPLSSVR